MTQQSEVPEQEREYVTSQVITYLGNKRALLDFIGSAVQEVQRQLGRDKLTVGDLFSGSGIVARYFKRFASRLVVNDLERYCEVLNQCYLANRSQLDLPDLRRIHAQLCSELEGPLDTDGFITRMYAPRDENNIQRGERVFYTPRNARFIDTARRLIDALEPGIQPFFLAPLLAEASVKNNTSGVFKGFYKNARTGIGQFGGTARNALSRICCEITLPFPVFSQFECPIEIYCGDALEVAQTLRPLDLVYLDPPYNQHPYGSNYFMLNLICDKLEPEDLSPVSGIPREWNRSVYNRSCAAFDAFSRLCAAIRAHYLLISFNSEGFITRAEMTDMLSQLGAVQVMETPYNTFRASRNLQNRSLHTTEYLFLVRKD